MKSFWKDKSVLITGFIGSHLVKELLPICKKIVVVDNFERGRIENLSSVADKVEIYRFDLRRPCHLASFFKEIDVVYHMASKVGGIGVYLNKKYDVLDVNMTIDKNVLNAALVNKVPYYFYASSAHVYPLGLQTEINAPKIKEEQAYPAHPLLSYGWAKLIAEIQILNAVEENDFFNAAIARYIGIYGKGLDYQLESGSVLPVFSHRAAKYPAVPFNVWGSGAEKRSYCFVDDAVGCTRLMVEKLSEEPLVGPLNVGKQERISIKEIAEKIIDISEKNISIDFDTSKKTHIWCQWCDCSKAKRVLGWEANTPLETGLREVYQDVLERITNEST
jgi:nucleoside-diphosphate-sugar epimerase